MTAQLVQLNSLGPSLHITNCHVKIESIHGRFVAEQVTHCFAVQTLHHDDMPYFSLSVILHSELVYLHDISLISVLDSIVGFDTIYPTTTAAKVSVVILSCNFCIS